MPPRIVLNILDRPWRLAKRIVQLVAPRSTKMPTAIDEFLQHARVADGCYVVGTSSFGVTLRRQQVRALNLAYALSENGVLSPPGDVAVIGGGVAGLTVASALLALGANVTLFERRPTHCHLQEGCDTRWVHPYIWDWPHHGTLQTDTGLPILAWSAGRASDVARSIIDEWNRIKLSHKGAVTEYMEANVNLRLKENTIDWRGVNAEGQQRVWTKRKFPLIVLAVGFGRETSIPGMRAVSYWRNDPLNQPEPIDATPQFKRILISGIGDGGIIDTIRAKVTAFREDVFIKQLFIGSPESIEFVDKLRALANDRDKDAIAFADKLEELCESSSFTKEIDNWLRPRLRRDTQVTLNTHQSARHLLCGRASVLNLFILARLKAMYAIEHVEGVLERVTTEDGSVQAHWAGKTEPSFYESVVVRHGSDRNKAFAALGIDTDLTKRATGADPKTTAAIGERGRLWPAGWWHTAKVVRRGIARFSMSEKHDESTIEFVPPAVLRHATAFVDSLANALSEDDVDANNFRMTIHRLVRIGEHEYFQQISPYCGGFSVGRPNATPGRVFRVKSLPHYGHGMIGLASRTGRAVLACSADTSASSSFLQEQAELLDGPKPSKPRSGAQSIVAIPITGNHNGKQYTSLVLFADSDSHQLFADEQGDKDEWDIKKGIARRIIAASREFLSRMPTCTLAAQYLSDISEFRGCTVEPTKLEFATIHYASLGESLELPDARMFEFDAAEGEL